MKNFKKISIMTIIGISVLTNSTLASTGKVKNAESGLILRESASKSGEIIETVKNGEQVEILEEDGDWYKVKYNEKEGYLYANYVEIEKSEIEAEAPEEKSEEIENQEENVSDKDTYPYKAKLSSEGKTHIMPQITSTVTNTLESGKEVSVEKALNDWLYISFENNEKSGWIRKSIIETVEETKTEVEEQPEEQEENVPEEETAEQVDEQQETEVSITEGYVNSSSVNVRDDASTDAKVVTSLLLNTKVNIINEKNGWYKISYNDYTGYIRKDLISEKPTTTSRSTTEDRNNDSEKTEIVEENVNNSDASSDGQKIVDFALKYKGYRYVLGGTTPEAGFDCTGFTYYVYNSCGYTLSRSCSVQAKTGIEISKSNLQPGDLLLFDNTSDGSIGHVGIYIGNGNFVHAANPNRGVVTDTINSGYYNTYYYSARRIVE